MSLSPNVFHAHGELLAQLFSAGPAARLAQNRDGSWTVRRAVKNLPVVHIVVGAEGWSFRVPGIIANPARDHFWASLAWNHQFTGGVKLVLDASRHAIDLRVEFWLEDDTDPEPHVRRTIASLANAVPQVRRLSTGRPASTSGGDAASDFANHGLAAQDGITGDVASGEIAELCAASNWPSHAREVGFAMTLETPHGFYQAMVDKSSRGAVSARVELLAVAEAPEVQRHATGLLLLESTQAVRFARAVRWSSADGRQAIGFDVLLGGNVTPMQLSNALAALSVACRLCAREVALLADERIARAFLRLRGLSS